MPSKSLPRPKASTRRPIVPREKVLVEMLGNGLVQVYADDNIDVHFFNRLFVEMEDGETANMIDEYHEGTMPRCYRELYFPSGCRAIGFHEKITVEAAKFTLWKKSIVCGLREMREENKK